ncbi:MAG: peptide chain release factor N(5)-glutamine methyltransferase [Elusimicrobia bacterium]|nr:peptide chain release factor N(5)-glutamine methyltransferase [Elusimicrobiota bacterium]
MVLRGLLQVGEEKLGALPIYNPQMEALWLLWSSLGKDRTPKPQDLYFHLSSSAPETLIQTYEEILQRRLNGIPLPYILGEQEFMGHTFHISPDVLIPRQETEILVEEATILISQISTPNTLEIGTGSGIISILIAKKFTDCRVTATDVSEKALRMAQENAHLHGVRQKITFLESNLFSNVSAASRYDFILSNPPYIPTDEISQLQREIQREPRIALDGGKDGYQIIRPLIQQSQKYLKSGGNFILEIGHNQSETVLNLMQKSGYTQCETLKDLSGHDRVIKGIYGQNID